MPTLGQASHFIINDSTFVETTNIVFNTEWALQHLYKHVARGASYDSKDQYEKPKCHPNTRNQLLRDIHEWIKVPEKETGITFLHGPAGAGKSCIARTACEQAAKEGLLGASFFFWRGSSSRNNEGLLVTTLAYQLAEASAELKQQILSTVATNPSIFDKPLEAQFKTLILEPCSKVPRDNLVIQAIVIDGLDECMGEGTQVAVLEMLSRATRKEGFPLGFFITSRPELHIQEALDSKEVIFATNVVSLNRIPGVSQDIRTVLESGFIRILNNPRFKRAFKHVSRPWPSLQSINKLVQDSSGQFIYAETVLKFISDPDCNPASQLEIMLRIQDRQNSQNTSTESPLANLDRLYSQIMCAVRHPELTLKVLSYVIAIKDLARIGIELSALRFSLVLTRAVLHNQHRLLTIIEQLLGLPDGMAYSSLNQLHSLISLKVGSESTRRQLEIDFYHQSFQDFLLSKQRSTTFHVNLDRAHFEIAHSCLKFMELSRYETEAQHGWLYSSFQWSVHNVFGNRKVDITNFNLALRTFFFGSSSHLNNLKLNEALATLGLVRRGKMTPERESICNIEKYGLLPTKYLTHAWEGVHAIKHLPQVTGDSSLLNEPLGSLMTPFNIIENIGSLSLEDLMLMHVANNVHELICDVGVRSVFNRLYRYPMWQRFLHKHMNDVSEMKKFLAVHCITDFTYPNPIPESGKYKLLRALGVISDDTWQSPARTRYAVFTMIAKDFMIKSNLAEFLGTGKFSGIFHCTAQDLSNIYTAIVHTGVWRNSLSSFCFSWGRGPIIIATEPLLTWLVFEASNFEHNNELIDKLNPYIEHYLFKFLRERLQGPTADIIRAWERTFQTARSFRPGNFSSATPSYGKPNTHTQFQMSLSSEIRLTSPRS